ncbi:MAG: hypothetical protein WAK17_07905 [Candidatus Nitrosopolaris sp.]
MVQFSADIFLKYYIWNASQQLVRVWKKIPMYLDYKKIIRKIDIRISSLLFPCSISNRLAIQNLSTILYDSPVKYIGYG